MDVHFFQRFSYSGCIEFRLILILVITNAVCSQLIQKAKSNEDNLKDNTLNEHHGDAESDPDIQILHMETGTKGEYYALSPSKLIHLAELEQEIYLILFNCNKSQRFGLEWSESLKNEIHTYLVDYEEGTLIQGEDAAVLLNKKTKAKEIASNPLMAYRMIRRFVSHITLLHNDKDFKALDFQWCRKLSSLLKDVKLPTNNDERDAIESIHRIQAFHNFYSSDLAKGIFGSIKTTGILSTAHLVELGLYALIEKYFVLAIEWLEFARSTVKKAASNTYTKEHNIDESNTYAKEDIDEYIKIAKKEHDAVWEDLKYDDAVSRQTLYVKRFSDLVDGYESTVKGTGRRRIMDDLRDQNPNHFGNPDAKEVIMIRYIGLCSGKNYQTEKEKRELHCWYERDTHPYWKINPLKMELLHPEPRLVRIYDIFGDECIDKIIAETNSSLKVSETVATVSNNKITSQVTSDRTSVNGWIYDRSSFHMKSFYKKIEFFTGFNLRASEPLQVAGYSFGGQYTMHTDCVSKGKLKETFGQRIATFMTYLKDVRAGGFTAFPFLGTAVTPVKGSALFWYNSFKNDICDDRFVHGGCPVILGTKYIANLWIHSHSTNTLLNRECSLEHSR